MQQQLPHFPEHRYADCAPLPGPFTEHLFQWMLRKGQRPLENIIPYLLREVAESRRYLYIYMDSYVRNRNKPVPREYQFTSEWVRETMAMYRPDHEPPDTRTFTRWIKDHILATERKGRPAPDSAAALILLRMMITDEHLMIGRMAPSETWHCFAQIEPGQNSITLPISGIPTLPPSALVWTGWPGAAWNGWQLVGKDEGAMAFAGQISPCKHHPTLQDLLRWRPGLANQYDRKNGRVDDQIHALTQLALVQLAAERIPQ
ncbi:MAG: hypothetical protein J2P36_26160 [Ktedonobacteraceae bacterium]|nr:hypothetical protein [Ktedonobacteraceae bacterium]